MHNCTSMMLAMTMVNYNMFNGEKHCSHMVNLTSFHPVRDSSLVAFEVGGRLGPPARFKHVVRAHGHMKIVIICDGLPPEAVFMLKIGGGVKLAYPSSHRAIPAW